MNVSAIYEVRQDMIVPLKRKKNCVIYTSRDISLLISDLMLYPNVHPPSQEMHMYSQLKSFAMLYCVAIWWLQKHMILLKSQWLTERLLNAQHYRPYTKRDHTYPGSYGNCRTKTNKQTNKHE